MRTRRVFLLALSQALLLAALPVAAVGPGKAAAVQAFERDGMERIRAAHKGKPFALMLWSLECSYCLDNMRALARLNRQQGLAVATIATDRQDDPDTVRQIQEKLHRAGLAGSHYAFGDGSAESLRHAVDPRWRGELPRTYVFDAAGGVRAHSGLLDAQALGKLGLAQQ